MNCPTGGQTEGKKEWEEASQYHMQEKNGKREADVKNRHTVSLTSRLSIQRIFQVSSTQKKEEI